MKQQTDKWKTQRTNQRTNGQMKEPTDKSKNQQTNKIKKHKKKPTRTDERINADMHLWRKDQHDTKQTETKWRQDWLRLSLWSQIEPIFLTLSPLLFVLAPPAFHAFTTCARNPCFISDNVTRQAYLNCQPFRLRENRTNPLCPHTSAWLSK